MDVNSPSASSPEMVIRGKSAVSTDVYFQSFLDTACPLQIEPLTLPMDLLPW